MTIKFLRIKDVMTRKGNCRSAIYADVKAGLLPPPIKIGVRASAWPESEISEVQLAQIAGRSPDYIRALVASLVKARMDAEGGAQ